MKKLATLVALTVAVTAAAACSDDEPTVGPGTNTPDARAPTGDDDDAAAGEDPCAGRREQDVVYVDAVSTREVKTLEQADGVTTIQVDATAGGTSEASRNPRIYISLATATRVGITDQQAKTSTDWDLALKRSVLFTNSGEGGKGQGGAQFLKDKAFGDVTAADATNLVTEDFIDEANDCSVGKDDFNAIKTSFSGWYSYNQSTHYLTPAAGTHLVKSGSGKLFKVEIVTFNATADGTPAPPTDISRSGNYVLKIAPVE